MGYFLFLIAIIIALENTFKHGVEKLTENTYIHIGLTTDNGNILFEIENNFEQPDTKHNVGIGLDNLKQRLQLLYPKKHQLIIESNNSVYKFMLKLDAK